MNSDPLKKFINRFKNISAVEKRELDNADFKDKFKQLVSVFALGVGIGADIDKKRTQESLKSNWRILKT